MIQVARNHVELLKQFESDSSLLVDEVRLTALLLPHCKLNRMRWRGSRLRLLQFPLEFARFLILMAVERVRSYLEIGTSTGGTFMAADAYLRSAVPGFHGSVGYDRTAKLRDFEPYKIAVGSIDFRHQGSKEMTLGNEYYGAAFIDARHIERWVLHDYEKVKKHARIIGFHDIALQGSTVQPAWAHIKQQHHRWWEFIDQSAPVEARCGIGVVDTRS